MVKFKMRCTESGWVLHPMTSVVSFKEEGHLDTDTHTKGREPCYDGGRNSSDAATRQGMPRIASHHQQLGGGKEKILP